jgi:hypothetical protein
MKQVNEEGVQPTPTTKPVKSVPITIEKKIKK